MYGTIDDNLVLNFESHSMKGNSGTQTREAFIPQRVGLKCLCLSRY